MHMHMYMHTNMHTGMAGRDGKRYRKTGVKWKGKERLKPKRQLVVLAPTTWMPALVTSPRGQGHMVEERPNKARPNTLQNRDTTF